MTPSADLVLSWIDTPQGMAVLAREWDDLAERVGADVYLRPDWQAVWWDHFAAGRRLACLEARVGGALVGLLPFALERIWLGPLPQRIARLSATDPHCIVFQLPLEPDWAEPVLAAAVTHLTTVLGCVAISFTPLSDLSTHLAPLRALARPGTGLVLVDDPAGTHTVFDLPGTFDAYLKLLASKRRSQFRSRVKGLEETFAMTAGNGTADAAAFDDFVAFHGRQWQAAGRGGHFVDWPGSTAFYRDFTQRSAAKARVRLYRLAGTSGPIVTQFCLLAAGTAHWRLPARTLDPAAERLGSGTVGLVKMIEQLIGQGITRIEAGRGEYSYKLDYGGRTVPVHRLILRPDRPDAAARVALLLGWSDLLNYAYYRGWFLKLSPRLQQMTGRGPRPLWRCWIRSRL